MQISTIHLLVRNMSKLFLRKVLKYSAFSQTVMFYKLLSQVKCKNTNLYAKIFFRHPSTKASP